MMKELPLFPLNTVLFPGMPITLHIFEERYKQMINHCLSGDRSFGVVLIRRGFEVGDEVPLPFRWGALAHIVQVQQLSEGRMNLLALGRERFRIVTSQQETPYLTATVELVPLPPGDPLQTEQAGRRLFPWVRAYLERLSDLNELEFESDFLPEGALNLAYMAAHLLQIPADQKQRLLAAESAGVMMAELRRLYRREVALLEQMVSRPPPDDAGTFSLS